MLYSKINVPKCDYVAKVAMNNIVIVSIFLKKWQNKLLHKHRPVLINLATPPQCENQTPPQSGAILAYFVLFL